MDRTSLEELYSPRSRENSRNVEISENSTKLAELLEKDEPDLENAIRIIEQERDLAYKDIQFRNMGVECSVASYLSSQFPSYSEKMRKIVRDFLEYINHKCPGDEVYKDIGTMIKTNLTLDDTCAESYQLLIDLIAYKPFDKEKATPEQIVEYIINVCIIRIIDETFDFPGVINALTRDTMQFARTVDFESLTHIVENIQKSIKDPKDPKWVKLRKTVGAIVNNTAEHYMNENTRVESNFKRLLFLCLTVIGVIVPLLYYHLKVKPTRDASPLVVFEMKRSAFENATKKNSTLVEETEKPNPLTQSTTTLSPRNTVHRTWTSSIDRHIGNENEIRLISAKHGGLKRFVFFSPNTTQYADSFNGTIPSESFVTPDAQVRWIALKGAQADQTFEKLDGEQYNVVLGAAAA